MTGSSAVKLYGSGSSTKVGTDACVSCRANGQGGCEIHSFIYNFSKAATGAVSGKKLKTHDRWT